ncbi:MAG: PilC/PilY family type IV pilus protein [Pseudomonadota bacterium]
MSKERQTVRGNIYSWAAVSVVCKKAATLVWVALLSSLIGVATADDTEIFFNSEPQPPNVLFIVDVSGSMNWTENSQPPNIAGNVLWLDASDRNTLLDAEGDPSWRWWRFSGRIARWRDKSGHGHDLVGTNATLDRIANRTSVRFTNDLMSGPDIFNGQMKEATVFLIQQENVRSSNFFVSFNGSDTSRSNRASFHTPWSNGSWYWDPGTWRTNRAYVGGKPAEVGEVVQLTAYKSVKENRNGISLNNGTFHATSANATVAATSKGVLIGSRARDHELAEMLVYDRKLTEEEIQSVQSYLDQKWRSRLDRVKVALNSVLENTHGFNAGLMSYSSYVRGQFSLRNEVKAIADTRTSLIDNINSLYASGGTPTQSAMYEGMRYFRGESPIDMGGIRSSGPPSVVGTCQSNHIVVLTDGYPYGRSNEYTRIGNHIGINCRNDRGNNRYGGNCGIELAQYMKDTDHYPTVPGLNDITTHTIGMSINMPWLEDIANAGGGGYYAVSSSQELVNAFDAIMEAAFDQSITFVAPSVSVDQISRLSHRDDTYLALFQPTNTVRWPGNLKRYRFGGNPPTIRDQNNEIALEKGFFKKDAHSYWSDTPDGGVVQRGGAAGKLDVNSRTVVTFAGAGTEYFDDSRNWVHEDNSAVLGNYINLTGSALKNLLAWARGVDVDDEDNDNSKTDTRHHIGDPLHSKPVIVNYGGSTANPDSVVFFGTNEGYLHAINSKDGRELYSFIPKELLGNLEAFYNNETSTTRPYGLDGDITLWLDDKNNNGIVDPASEHAYLYIGMRRGGNNYYAIDVTEKHNPKYMWTISGGSGDFAELGQSWSKPVKTKISINNDIRDVLVFAGGYDPAQDTKTRRSDDSVGNTIYIVDAKEGKLIWKTALDRKSDYSAMRYSIPSDIAVIDMDGDKLADQFYVGDMGGQVWRFDVNRFATSATELVSGGIIADLAGNSADNNRRFFYPPDVVLVSKFGQTFLSVAIGSGNRANPLGKSIEDRFYMIRQQSFNRAPEGYGMVATPAIGNVPAAYRAITESDLYDATANNINSSDTNIALNATELLEQAQGWVLHMPTDGEKVLGSSVTIDNKIVFTSYRPADFIDPCSPPTGYNRAYVINLFNAAPDEGTTPEDRSEEIDVAGIAGTVTAIIRENKPNGGQAESEWTVNPVVGMETLAFPGVNMTQRVYWSEYPNF